MYSLLLLAVVVVAGQSVSQENALDGQLVSEENALDGQSVSEKNALDGQLMSEKNALDGQSVSEKNALEEVLSAVIVSQLTLSHQTSVLTELLTATRERNFCPQGPTCPYPYTLVLDECFYLSPHLVTWEAARRHCQGMMGDLATPKYLYAIKSFLLNKSNVEGDIHLYVFVGFKDNGRNGTWKWLDGRTVDAADWYPGEPNNLDGDEYCGHFRSHFDPMLNDHSCSVFSRFLCQYHPAN
ncbi:C-type lectin lectoxin-Enh4-like [Procambarus clarkii]|uniref:C-type lectin lectoxin-Enh4-like n=1 Tax=Procambarus clarkii TaxID=6728 RepID=UPI003743A3B5